MSDLTKKALAGSLKTLMNNSTLDKITVKELTQECGVNRQTFYYHFNDIYKLIEWIYTEEAVSNIAKYKTYETWQHGFSIVFEYVKRNLTFCKNCLNSAGRDYLERYLHDTTYNLLYGVVTEVAQKKNIPQQDLSFIAKFYTYAFIGIMIEWIRSGAKDDPVKIIDDINRLIEGDIYKAINKKTRQISHSV